MQSGGGITGRALDEDAHGVPLRFEDGFFDVPEILAVGLERKRTVAHELDSVEIVGVAEVSRVGLAPPREGVAK